MVYDFEKECTTYLTLSLDSGSFPRMKSGLAPLFGSKSSKRSAPGPRCDPLCLHRIFASEFITKLINIQKNSDHRMCNDRRKIHRDELRYHVITFSRAIDTLTQAARITAIQLKAISACSCRLLDLLGLERRDPLAVSVHDEMAYYAGVLELVNAELAYLKARMNNPMSAV